MYVEGGTVVDYLWCYCCYILGRRAGLLSHAKPIQARLSGDPAQMPTVYHKIVEIIGRRSMSKDNAFAVEQVFVDLIDKFRRKS